MKELYVMIRQNKENQEDITVCCAGSNETFHYTSLDLAIKDKANIEALYGDEETYTIYKLVNTEDNN